MMRALFLLLVLANLGLFAWYRWYVQPGDTAAVPAALLKGEPLKLVTELTPAERKALASQPEPAPAPATGSIAAPAPPVSAPGLATVPVPASALACATFGPFTGGAVTQAADRLKQLGLTSTQHSVPGKAKLGYWVYLPPFRSRKEADAAADMLRRRGVKDIYVVGDEANRNAISLGVFSQHDGAVERTREMKKIGFKPVLAERFRDEPRYWLDAKGSAPALPTADAFKDLGEEGNPVTRATGSCTTN